MEHRLIGNTGLRIPPLIFGTSSLGNLYSALSDEIKTGIIKECIDNVPGPVVFDSAGKYGAGLALEKTGEILGNLGVNPDNVIISNKLGWLRTQLSGEEPSFEKGVWADLKNDAVQKISFDGIMECWEQGNLLLGGRYKPAMVSVHDPDEYLAQAGNKTDLDRRLAEIREAYRALNILKSEGQVKAIGVGAKKWDTIRIISEEADLDWVMFANSMTIYRHPVDLLRFMVKLRERGIAIINSAVFHAGFLTGGDFFDYVKLKPDSPENKEKFIWRDTFFSICQKYSIKAADACVQFAMTAPGVISISLNTSRPERVKDNVASVNNKVPREFWEEIRRKGLIDDEYPYL